MRRWLLVACLILLAIQASVQIRLASLDSATTDEAVHLSAGYTYLTEHDWRFNPEHPPLIKILAALPLLAIKPRILAPAEDLYNQSDNFFYDSWRENRVFGEMMMYQSGNNPDQILFWARMPMVALTFILGLVILLIAWRHFGEKAAIIATALYAFNPTVNGHGHLITTDIGIALGFLLTVYSFWRLLGRPSWLNCLWLGLSFGLALLTKHTAIIILPILAMLAILRTLDRTTRPDWQSVGSKTLIVLLITWAVIWTGYGWHDRVAPASSSISQAITVANNESGTNISGPNNPQPVTIVSPKLDHFYSLIQPALVLLPGDYLKGLIMVLGHVSSGQSSFLLGQTSKTGWWYYFPVLLLTKTPLSELILIALGIYLVVKQKAPDWRLGLGFTAAAAMYFLLAMLSKADLGIRHIMPFFSLIFLAAAAGLASESWRGTKLTIVLIIWLGLTFGLSFPTYLGYYNELVGGSNNGYKIATDSNLDWGQDLLRIKIYINAHPDQNYYIEYGWLGQSALDYYLGSSHYQLLSDWQLGQPGQAIIGASSYNTSILKDNLTACQPVTNGVFDCQLHD